MSVRKPRIRGAAIRAAIQKMPLTELLALRRDLGTFQPGAEREVDLPEALRAFDETARLAMLAAFRVGGTNGSGPKHAAAIRSPHVKAALSGGVFTPGVRVTEDTDAI